jgi:hypothetical protein
MPDCIVIFANAPVPLGAKRLISALGTQRRYRRY